MYGIEHFVVVVVVVFIPGSNMLLDIFGLIFLDTHMFWHVLAMDGFNIFSMKVTIHL